MEALRPAGKRHAEIEVAAYYLWQQRGRPIGSPEVDWLKAEEQLRLENSETSSEPAMIAVAKAMGAALGSVAGLVASVSTLTHSGEPSERE